MVVGAGGEGGGGRCAGYWVVGERRDHTHLARLSGRLTAAAELHVTFMQKPGETIHELSISGRSGQVVPAPDGWDSHAVSWDGKNTQPRHHRFHGEPARK